MTIYTIGFTKKSAEDFFELVKSNNIDLMIDVRLNNKSQLAGFSKGSDLSYFLNEICGCVYAHCVEFAPTAQLLSDYRKGIVTWSEYEQEYDRILEERGDYKSFVTRFEKFNNVCLLCSEATPEHCHRRLLAEKIRSVYPSFSVVHI